MSNTYKVTNKIAFQTIYKQIRQYHIDWYLQTVVIPLIGTPIKPLLYWCCVIESDNEHSVAVLPINRILFIDSQMSPFPTPIVRINRDHCVRNITSHVLFTKKNLCTILLLMNNLMLDRFSWFYFAIKIKTCAMLNEV